MLRVVRLVQYLWRPIQKARQNRGPVAAALAMPFMALALAVLVPVVLVCYLLYITFQLLGFALINVALGALAPFLRLAAFIFAALVAMSVFGTPMMYMDGCYMDRWGQRHCPGVCGYLGPLGYVRLIPYREVPHPCPFVFVAPFDRSALPVWLQGWIPSGA